MKGPEPGFPSLGCQVQGLQEFCFCFLKKKVLGTVMGLSVALPERWWGTPRRSQCAVHSAWTSWLEKLPLPLPSQSGLGFWDIDLNAVRTLSGRALAKRGGPLGCQEPLAGFLPLPVHGVQGTVLHWVQPGTWWLLWYQWRHLLFLLPRDAEKTCCQGTVRGFRQCSL